MEKILKRKTVFSGSVVSVDEVDIDFDNGNKATFELIHFKNKTGVSALPIDENDNVIFIRQYKLGLDKRILTIPSGGLEEGVDPSDQINDELQEEIGFKSNNLTLMINTHASPGYVDSPVSYVFLAEDLVVSKKEGDEVEDTAVVKIPYKKALQMVKEGELVDSKTIQAILYYQQFIRSKKQAHY